MPVVWYEGDDKADYLQLKEYTGEKDWNDFDEYGTSYGNRDQWNKMNNKNRIGDCLRGQGSYWQGLDNGYKGQMEIIKAGAQNVKNQKNNTGVQQTVKELTHVIVAKGIHPDSDGDHLSVCCNGLLWHIYLTIDTGIVGEGKDWRYRVRRVTPGYKAQSVTTDGWQTQGGKRTRLFHT